MDLCRPLRPPIGPQRGRDRKTARVYCLRARAKTTSDFSASSPSPHEERTGRGPGRGAPTKVFELRLRLGTYFCTDPKPSAQARWKAPGFFIQPGADVIGFAFED